MKLKYFYLCILTFINIHGSDIYKKHAITHGLSLGRFGDQILSYCQARYLSYITSVPFLYRSFIFSDQLNLDYNAKSYDQYHSQFRHTFHINTGSTLADFLRQIQDPETPSTIYMLDYLPTDITEWDIDPNRMILLNIPWKNSEFYEFLSKTIYPRISIPNFTKEGVLNVAVHVRTLSGFDTVTSLIGFPLKHPKTDYYKRQVNRIYNWNAQRAIHVFIFSDTDKPLDLLHEFQKTFEKDNIEFNIQTVTRADLNNTVQDFFSMQKFDVLVATQSNLSMMASRLGNFDMIFSPVHVKGEYPNYYIDRVQVISKKSSWFPYELNIIFKD